MDQLVFLEGVLNPLGWALMHSIWMIALVLCFVAFCFRFIGTQHSNIRYGIAYGSLLLVFVATLFLLIPNIDFTAASLPVNVGAVQEDLTKITITETFHLLVNEGVFSFDKLLIWLDVQAGWIAVFWSLGFLLYSIKYGLAFAQTVQIRRSGLGGIPRGWQEKMEAWIEEAEISKNTVLQFSKLVDSPITMGFFKPIILVPIGFFSALSPDQVEAVLLHEIAHIKRHDYLLNLIQKGICTFFFFHPGIHLLSRWIDAEREHACDDFAVGKTGDPKSLAEALGFLRIQSFYHQNELVMNAKKQHHPLLFRLQRLFGGSKPAAQKVNEGHATYWFMGWIALCLIFTFSVKEVEASEIEETLDPIPAVLENVEIEEPEERILETLEDEMEVEEESVSMSSVFAYALPENREADLLGTERYSSKRMSNQLPLPSLGILDLPILQWKGDTAVLPVPPAPPAPPSIKSIEAPTPPSAPPTPPSPPSRINERPMPPMPPAPPELEKAQSDYLVAMEALRLAMLEKQKAMEARADKQAEELAEELRIIGNNKTNIYLEVEQELNKQKEGLTGEQLAIFEEEMEKTLEETLGSLEELEGMKAEEIIGFRAEMEQELEEMTMEVREMERDFADEMKEMAEEMARETERMRQELLHNSAMMKSQYDQSPIGLISDGGLAKFMDELAGLLVGDGLISSKKSKVKMKMDSDEIKFKGKTLSNSMAKKYYELLASYEVILPVGAEMELNFKESNGGISYGDDRNHYVKEWNF